MPVLTRSRAAAIAGSITNSAGTTQAPAKAAVCKDAAQGVADKHATSLSRSAKSSGTLKPNIHTEGKPSLAETRSTSESVEIDTRQRKRRRLDNESRDTYQSSGGRGSPPQEPSTSTPEPEAAPKKQIKRGNGWTHRERTSVRKQARVKVFAHKNINESNENYGDAVVAMTGMLEMSKNADSWAIGILQHERERVKRLRRTIAGYSDDDEVVAAARVLTALLHSNSRA